MSEEIKNEVLENNIATMDAAKEPVYLTEMEPEGGSIVGKVLTVIGGLGLVAAIGATIKNLPEIKKNLKTKKIEKYKDFLVDNGYNCIHEDEAVIVDFPSDKEEESE